jgi:heat-inducible transcriptional repressor
MATLPERRARILSLIVRDYVGSAQPVGSQALVARHRLALSSATVRNEMAALEEEGLITHPHTSAGRIPSNPGYRLYVRSLMPDHVLSETERLTILHQFHQSARELEQWVGLAASVLANAMHNVALVTPPRTREVRLKQLQLVELSESRALLVVVTSDAAVHQLTLEFAQPVHQEALTVMAARLNRELGGRTADEIGQREASGPLAAIESAVVSRVREMLIREQDALNEAPVVEGVREMLRQPEFEHSDRVLDTLEAVDDRRLASALPLEAVRPGDVAVVIGDENREGPYREMSFVLARYGPKGGAGGVVGILGPTRMPYSETVGHVRYVADVLTELIREFYGEE